MNTTQMRHELADIGRGAHALAIQIMGDADDAADAAGDLLDDAADAVDDAVTDATDAVEEETTPN